MYRTESPENRCASVDPMLYDGVVPDDTVAPACLPTRDNRDLLPQGAANLPHRGRVGPVLSGREHHRVNDVRAGDAPRQDAAREDFLVNTTDRQHGVDLAPRRSAP